MRVLCSFPGRNGDILWALPVIRAISQHYGVPVDLQLAGEFTEIVPLLRLQSYLGKVWADPRWAMVPPEEWKAPVVESHDVVVHCGYRGWPEQGLPFWTEQGVKANYPELAGLQVDYESPWITMQPVRFPARVACGFSDEWFELKFGVYRLLAEYAAWSLSLYPPHGSRWEKEAGERPTDWLQLAGQIAGCRVFFGCCSAPHVLAYALGKPVVILEPSLARHNPIFYPFGMDGPRITVVKGNDGLPTVDARHCAETIERVLHAQRG